MRVDAAQSFRLAICNFKLDFHTSEQTSICLCMWSELFWLKLVGLCSNLLLMHSSPLTLVVSNQAVIACMNLWFSFLDI